MVLLIAVYITWNGERIRGPTKMFYENELVFDGEGSDSGLVCKTDLKNKEPRWSYPNGILVPPSLFLNYRGEEQQTYFYQYFSKGASRILFRRHHYWRDRTNYPPGLYKCALRGHTYILTVGIYSSSGSSQCKMVN